MNTVDYGDDPYAVEQMQNARRMQLAQLLSAQGLNPAPSFSNKAGIARMLTGVLGQMDMGRAEAQERELAQRRASEKQAEMGQIVDLAQGGDDKRADLARLLAKSSNPQLQAAGLSMLMKGPSKLEKVDLGDKIGMMDESGKIVRELPKGVTPDTRYSKETVGADTRFTRETPSADALITDARTKAEGAANRAVTMRGQDLTNDRSVDANATANANKNVQLTEGIRKEFEALPEVKNYKAVVPIIASAKKAPNTPAGDIDLIYAVGKIMDPNSVVREGELKLVIAAGSPAQKLQGMVNYVTGGGRLGPDQRKQLMETLDNRTNALKGQYDQARSSYESILKKQNLDPEQVFTNIGPASARTVVRTGKLDGRKVVQYSDGTTEYAD